MKTTTRFALTSLALISGMLAASNASALEESSRGPFYVQGTVLGFATIATPSRGCEPDPLVPTQQICENYGGAFGTYRIGAEFGWHPSGRHDGFVVGFRQMFLLGGASFGSSQVRLGYDIAIPVKRFEITIAPYGVVGIGYGFGGGAAFDFGIGVEGKFFFMEATSSAGGLYAFAQPIEIGGWVPGGFAYQFGAGIGYAF